MLQHDKGAKCEQHYKIVTVETAQKMYSCSGYFNLCVGKKIY
jgi:hypothetical protein